MPGMYNVPGLLFFLENKKKNFWRLKYYAYICTVESSIHRPGGCSRKTNKFRDMKSFIDEVGATRHAMSNKELNELYKRLENFIADCTIEEAKENRDAFVKVQTLIHQRIRENKK